MKFDTVFNRHALLCLSHVAFIALLMTCSDLARAAPVLPDAGALLKGVEQERNSSGAQPTNLLTPAPASTPGANAAPDAVVWIRGFRFTGATLVKHSLLHDRLFVFVGTQAGLGDLQKAADLVMRVYREAGFTARAFLPPQDILGGIIEIAVIEGILGQVRMETGDSPTRLDPALAAQYLEANQQRGQPIENDRIERGLLLLSDLDGVKVGATLAPGKSIGETDVVVRLSDTPMVSASVDVSNHGARGTGAEQVLFTANLNSPTRRGDRASIYLLSSQGLDYARADYVRPIGLDGLKIGFNATQFRYRLIGDFAASGVSGDSTVWGVTADYPIIRHRLVNLAASAAAITRKLVTNSGTAIISDRRIDAVNLTLAGNRFDNAYRGGNTVFGATLTTGRIAFKDAGSLATDALGPRTAGSFHKLNWRVMRTQSITDQVGLNVSLRGQMASTNLDASEKIYLGGPGGIRAYPVSEAGGDNGVLASVALQYFPLQGLEVSTFFDYGTVQTNKTAWTGATGPQRVTLSGAGFGLNWVWEGWRASGTVAWRLQENPLRDVATNTDSDGSHRVPRIFVTLGRGF